MKQPEISWSIQGGAVVKELTVSTLKRRVVFSAPNMRGLLDKVRGNTRFSWFIPKDGEFPDFWFLNPVSIRQDHWREVETPSARGFQRDGTPKNGDHLVLVTHRKGKLKLPTMQKR